MDVLLPECRYQPVGPKFTARMKHWRQTASLSEGATAYLLEISRFLAAVPLLLAVGVLLLMLE